MGIMNDFILGDTWQNKVAQLRMNLTRLECDAVVVTALEEIAWLLNVRGRDVPYGPFVRSYLIAGKSDLHWYVPPEKLGGDSGIGVKRQLKVELFGPFTVRYEEILTTTNSLVDLVVFSFLGCTLTILSSLTYELFPKFGGEF